MAKVVIDANILMSAAFGGKPLEVVIRAMGRHEVSMSREIEQELRASRRHCSNPQSSSSR